MQQQTRPSTSPAHGYHHPGTIRLYRATLQPSFAVAPALTGAPMPPRGQSILDADVVRLAAIRFERSAVRLEEKITAWMARYGIVLLRLSLGLVFFWFGVLKFFNGLSPAQALATRTISSLTLGAVPPHVSLPLLAAWECLIGLGFLTGKAQRATLLLLFVQMPGTLMPLFLYPFEVFARIPYAPTLEGQYIIKNVVLISAALVIGGTVRGRRVPAREVDSRFSTER
jgi:uncharacterized membrane protein YkgB